MAGNKNFSQTIQYKGTLDISQIISQLKKVRDEFANSSTLKGKNSLFVDVDKEIQNIEKLSVQMQAAIQKGFSNPKDIKEFEKITQSLDSALNKVSVNLKNINMSKLTQEQKEAANNLKNIISSEKQQISNQMQIANAGTKYVKTLIEGAKSGKELEDVQKEINNQLDQQIKKQQELKASSEGKVKETYSKLASVPNFTNKSFQIINDTNEKQYVSKQQYGEIRNIFAKVVTEEKTAEKALQSFNKQLQEMGVKATNQNTVAKYISQAFDSIPNDVSKAKEALKIAEAEFQKIQKNLEKTKSQKSSFGVAINSEEIRASYQKIVQAAQQAAQAENNVNIAKDKIGGYSPELQKLISQILEMRDGFNNASISANEAAEQQKKFDNSFDNLKNVVAQVLSLTSAWNGFKRIVQETYNDVKNLDQAFASIAMVTEYSVGEMWDSYDQYADMAQKLGQSTQSVIEASALYYQQGLDTDDSLALTEETMKLATLAGLDFAEATSEMTAAIRGFNMEMDEGQRVTDVYSSLAAGAAAETEGIAYAMSKTASIASNAGMSFENTSAYLTKMIETTQEAPSNKN